MTACSIIHRLKDARTDELVRLGRRLTDAMTADSMSANVASGELHRLPAMDSVYATFYAKWGFAPDNSGTGPLRIRRGNAPIAGRATA